MSEEVGRDLHCGSSNEPKESDINTAAPSEPATEIEELEPSVLGTKIHWEDVYKEEMNVFEETGVVDEGWFGQDVETKVLRYAEKLESLQKSDRVVDLGCGNGSLLCELATRGYTNLTGIDFSEAATQLAKALFKSQNYEAEFHNSNILEDNPSHLGKFRLCLDKGTFDAISLNPDVDQKDAREKYFQYVLQILEDNGTFILISCNWTSAELETISKNWFDFCEEIPTQKFNFGGRPGNLVSIAVLRRKSVQ